MTEKIARRGARVLGEYSADFLDQLLARDFASKPVVSLSADDRLGDVRARIVAGDAELRHQGFPVLGSTGELIGVITRRDLLDVKVADDSRLAELIRRPPVVVLDDSTLRDAADQMTRAGVGRVPVLSRDRKTVLGMITRSDLLSAHSRRLDEAETRSRSR